MKLRVYVLLLLTALLVAGCGRRLPEGGIAASPSNTPVIDEATQPTEAPAEDAAATEEAPAEGEADAEATEEAPAEGEADAEATEEAPVEGEADAEATEEAPAEGDMAADTPVGDPVAGEEVFNTYIEAALFACVNCHYPDSEDRLVGPGLLGIGENAATRVDGQSAEEYIRNSILHPNDYVVDTYPENLMPQVYADELTEEQLNDVIAYVLSL